MNKTALKTFATTARRQLRDMAILKASQIGITAKEILQPTSKGNDYETYETKAGAVTLNTTQAKARAELVKEVKTKGFDNVIEFVAYTWFNRLVAVRYMEVNGYLPIYILGSQDANKKEPDMITRCPDVGFELSDEDVSTVEELRRKAQFDKLFQFLFIKCCSSLSDVLPSLFADESRGVSDYTKLLLDLNYTRQDSVVRELLALDVEDFKEQVQIIGWMYQYYNSELKDETFDALQKHNVKIDKDHIPAATQLFTPDWIVRYMVQNSVGRLYVEGHGKPSCKKDWKYYLDEAEQTPEVNTELDKIRAIYKKIQLEDMKILDPSMGSGHILVYAFDLLMQLYEEEGYLPEDAALLIAEKNLWGLDIDTRAWQLSSFALTMKVMQYNKKFFHANGSKWLCLARPLDLHVYAITESNGIRISNKERLGASKNIAEKLLTNFIDAKEYGSIISPTVTLAELDTLKKTLAKIDEMGSMGSLTSQIETEEIISGLWPLIDLATVFIQKYDVVTTNPPYMGYGGMGERLNNYVQSKYPDSKSDLFAVFIEKCLDFCKQTGFVSMITQHSWMFLGSYEKLRSKINDQTLINMAHLGPRAFDEIGGEVVQTTSFVINKNKIKQYKSLFSRLVKYIGEKEKEVNLKTNLFTCDIDVFKEVPQSKYLYSASENLRKSFKNDILSKHVNAVKGLDTCDNERFTRFWYEVNFNRISFNTEDTSYAKDKWYPYCKGGGYRKWYGFLEKIVDWENDGYVLRNLRDSNGKIKSRPQNTKYYFKEGLTWSSIASGKLSLRYMKNSIFGGGGSGMFCDSNCLYYLAYSNSSIINYLLNLMNPTLNFLVGDILSLPVIISDEEKVNRIVESNIKISKNDWDSFETSWDFLTHPLLSKTENLQHRGTLIKDSFDLWASNCLENFSQLKENEEEINSIFIKNYDLQDELSPEVKDEDITVRKADLKREIKSLISYAVGCMMGRYSLDTPGLIYAGGNMNDVMSKYKRFVPDEDAIIPINDNAWFKDDIVERFKSFLITAYGESTLEENMKFIADALEDDVSSNGTSEEKIRSYFIGKKNNKGVYTKGFYKDHLQTYQNRPIYWLFDSGNENGFKALIYMHRYDINTVERIHDEYLKPLQTLMDNAILTCHRTMTSSSSSERDKAEARTRISKLQQQQEEIAIYQPVLKHVALENIPIDLDDGVVVNYAKFQNQVLHRDNMADSKLDLLAKIK